MRFWQAHLLISVSDVSVSIATVQKTCSPGTSYGSKKLSMTIKNDEVTSDRGDENPHGQIRTVHL